MARFSLSPPSASSIKQREEQQQQQQSKDAPQWKWNYPPQDGYSYRQSSIQHSSTDEESSDESSTDYSSSEEDVEQSNNKDDESSNINDDDEEEEEEPPHPLGFEKYGKTRFGFSPQSTSNTFNNRTPIRGDIFNRDDEYAWNALIHIDKKKGGDNNSLIPTYHLKSRSYIPTSNLLAGATSFQYQEKKDNDNDDGMEDLLCGMDRIANLVKAASYVQTPRDDTTPSQTNTSTPRSTSKLLQLATICEQQQNQLSTEMSLIQQQRSESYKQSCQGFLLLLKADESKVNIANERINKRLSDIQQIEEKNKQEQLAHEEQVQQQLKAEQRAKEEYDAALAAQSEEERIKHEQHLQSLAIAEKEAEEEAAKKTAYITRAKSLITNLETVRSTLSNFDKSKSVSRRRLQFKKIVNGKINTLAHDTNKILEVSRMVGDAITNATNDDNNAQGGEPVLSMGKRYLIDLLCSNLIVRVQADGFNGTRGDGFPLANMFAQVSLMCEEINPVLEGHLYMVCPMAIPTLSLNDDSNNEGGGSNKNNEDDLMTGLGMIRDKKTGEFESFDKFLNRTEGCISIMANIMSSLPSEHTLLGGHVGALTWLQRFVDLLPPPPAKPLPLLTAPVLVAFLTGAGHMLANKFPNEFIPLLNSITKDVMNRLDDSSVGVPSATRLKKVLEDVGLDGMKKDLPQGAVEGLYDGKGGGNISSASLGSQFKTTAAEAPAPPPSSSTFGQQRREQQQPIQTSSPFQSQAAPASSPFGASTNTSGSTFGGMSSTTVPMDNSSSSSSAFGSSFGATSMGATTTTQPTQGFAAPTSSPFGGNTQPSPFAATQQAASPFGTTQTSTTSFATQSAPAPSPFGTSTNQTSWQSQPPQQQPQQQQAANSFSSFPQQQQNASPFNSSPSASGGFGQSPFSNTTQQTNTFGSSVPAASPFGNNHQQQPQTSTFGSSAPAASPFGNQQPQTNAFGSSPFGQQSQTNAFGSSAPVASPFGNTQQPQTSTFGSTPFGNTNQQQPQTSTFGSSNNAFGGNNNSFAPSPSPFGNNNNTNNSGQRFGQNNNTSSGNKPPCKFFAQGKCRNGANCKFSHDLPPGGNQASVFGGASGFRQQQSNPSPFSGGGGQGFGQNNNNNSGGGRTKPPCKFFAQGRCRNGANCKFSHDLPPGNQNQASTGGFGGGGFGQQTNPSPFRGSFGGGGFGGPRR